MKKDFLEKRLLVKLQTFIEKYGENALIIALKNYEDTHLFYTCKTKSFTKQIPIYSINYIEIFGHEIIIHTTSGDYTKYGTLKNEYALLKKMGFIKCNQSFLIPINKIAEIKGNNVIITTGNSFPLSRSCAPGVIQAYVKNNLN